MAIYVCVKVNNNVCNKFHMTLHKKIAKRFMKKKQTPQNVIYIKSEA